MCVYQHCPPTAHYSLPTTPYPLPPTHYPLPTTHYPLLTTHYPLPPLPPLPTTHYLLLPTPYPLPTTHYSLPTTRCDESSSGCRGTTSNNTDPCEPTLTGVYCRKCQDTEHYYVPASGAVRASCAKCGATFWTTFGIMVGAICSIFIPKKRAVAVVFGCLSLNAKKRALSIKQWLLHAHGIYRLDNKLKTLIGFYMIATKARILRVGRTHPLPSQALVPQTDSTKHMVVTDVGVTHTSMSRCKKATLVAGG